MKKVILFLLLIISIIPILDLSHPGLPITHDGQDHVARIANFYQNLAEGIIVPRWAENLNWGYGHPILMFLYPLPSYFASVFHAIGFNFVDSTKLVFGISFLISGFTMYLFINELFGFYPGILSSVLYMFAPYRFVDLYVRGDLGEHVFFIFPPLVLYFFLRLAKRKSPVLSSIGAALSLAGLILAHNAMALMFLPIICLYIVYLFFVQKKEIRFIIQSAISFVLGFGVAAFFWLPAFFEGKYTLRDIVTGKEALSRFVDFGQLVYSPWSYGITGQFSVQVGIAQWIIVVASIYALYKLYKRKKTVALFGLGIFIIFWISLFLMLPASKVVWEHVSIMQKFQFPWRFLSVAIFSCAVLGGVVVATLPKKYLLSAVLVISVITVYLNSAYWHPKGFQYKPEGFYSGIYNSTTDTGESAPIWSVRFMEHRPKAHMEVISGQATIQELKRTTTVHQYIVTAATKTRLRENTLYFPGWSITVDGNTVPIEFQDPANRGLMTFYVDPGKHTVAVTFKETKLRIISDYLSIFSLILLLIFGIIGKTKLWRRYQLF